MVRNPWSTANGLFAPWTARFLLAACGSLLLSAFVPAAAAASLRSSGAVERSVSVIVREVRGSDAAPEHAVERLGGSVGRRIGIINGFVARLPQAHLSRLRAAPGVHSVTLDARIRFLDDDEDDVDEDDVGSLFYVAQREIGAGRLWADGITGKGVDVALIDTGVVPVEGLEGSGKVVNGPDLSLESQADNVRYLDTFGHGTHIAGIIAGRDDDVDEVEWGDDENFLGVAPGARIVNVKVADAYGASDVSQVIAAIDWVVQHRRANGLNIRVLNLSFGTDGVQDYRVDPLAYAVEVAWRKGIVVVVAAGNGGFGTKKLNNPAYDPFVIAVGGADGNGTYDWRDDTVPAWSSYGDGARNPDLVAPGKSIVSLRAPNSSIDLAHPEGRVGKRFFRGSGTSQAAAVVSGAAALLIQQRATITPDEVKALLKQTASELPQADPKGQGAGMLDLREARYTSTPRNAAQGWTQSTGSGSLDLARGSARLVDGDVELRGEQDVFGAPWKPSQRARESLNEVSWSGGTFNGNAWAGDGWVGNAWSGRAWSGRAWSGRAWSGRAWSNNAWSGRAWSGRAWSGGFWNGRAWSGRAWSTALWGG